MPTRNANAVWEGDLQNGKGNLKLGSGAFEGKYTFKSRFEDGSGTNPEELIAAAHAGCYSMALSNELAEGGHDPESVETEAGVTLKMVDGDPTITTIKLKVEAHVPGISEDEFDTFAQGAKDGCPVSKALAGTDIELHTTLKN
jgi:osmotically inducible protein OsmC